jgi:hypothetical protein
MHSSFDHLIHSAKRAQELADAPPPAEAIAVSETISTAASVYELVRNALEYDEEHLLRRNAIRRILKRRLDETTPDVLGGDLLRELIWARYLPNKRVSETQIFVASNILYKYEPLFEAAKLSSDRHHLHQWLLDMLSTELEYLLSPHIVDESVASVAYQELKSRIKWVGKTVAEEDRDLQLYTAVHRAVLKSNVPTLRFRLFTLYYPDWVTSAPDSALVREVATGLPKIVESIEGQLRHPGADPLYRLVRHHAIVFHLLRDVCSDDPDAFAHMIETRNEKEMDHAIAKAAKNRYNKFRGRLRRMVIRAVSFLFLTKMVLAFIIELPYETLVLGASSRMPLLVNILFHPLLLAVIGLSARIPEEKNTKKIIEEVHALFGWGEDFVVVAKFRRPWTRGTLGIIFKLLYAAFFALSIGVIVSVLRTFDFNALSIGLFVFFLTLVTFFGLKIRNSKREVVIVETGGGVLGTIADVLFLPIISTGRWISLRAPRVNIFLFFFDFIIEAPFKAAIGLIEGWLAFVREKKEEI